jgi:hypothetical protein
MTNTQHISLDRSRPYVFLPINLSGKGPYVGNGFAQHLPRLAVVDVATMDGHPGLHTCLWKTTARGTVFRQYLDRGRRDEKGRAFRVNEKLALLVAGKPPFSPVYPLNLDPLDCRADNMAMAASLSVIRELKLKPGFYVEKLDGYAEALNDIRAFPSKYTSVLARTRAPKLDAVQLAALLQCVQCGLLKGQSARTIVEWVQAELGIQLTVQNVYNYLSGKTTPVHGFDYKALAATRLNPRERALERWRERQ